MKKVSSNSWQGTAKNRWVLGHLAEGGVFLLLLARMMDAVRTSSFFSGDPREGVLNLILVLCAGVWLVFRFVSTFR